MKNIKINLFYALIIANSMSASESNIMPTSESNTIANTVTVQLIQRTPAEDRYEEELAKHRTEKLTMETELKKCLRTNVHSTNLGAFGIPAKCVNDARRVFITAGREKAREIIADFHAATVATP